jgi:hypothetical protein
MFFSVGGVCLDSIVMDPCGMLLFYLQCGLLGGRRNCRTFSGVELSTFLLRSLLLRSLYGRMLIFCYVLVSYF